MFFAYKKKKLKEVLQASPLFVLKLVETLLRRRTAGFFFFFVCLVVGFWSR